MQRTTRGPTGTSTTGAPDNAWLDEHLQPLADLVLGAWDGLDEAVDDAVDDAGDALEDLGDLADVTT